MPPATDPQQLLDGLAAALPGALPPGVPAGAVEVRRDRSLADRVAGRPGRVAAVRVADGRSALTLSVDRAGARAESAVVSGGVVIARTQVPVGEWLRLLAARLADLAADAAGDAVAASRALVALGLAPASAVSVSEEDPARDLALLPALLAGRLPEAALPALTRVVDGLLDALPRVARSTEAALVLHRTATDYLPDTLRAYLALPADWAATHRLSDGTTPADALLEQLGRLDTAVAGMRDAAVAGDAAALEVNGLFLDDRFGTSSLEP